MKNISLNGEALKFSVENKYIIIDALYLNDIKEKFSSLDKRNLLKDIKEKIFPFTDTPFAEFIPTKLFFDPGKIKKVDNEELPSNSKNIFSTDTGLIIFIQEKLLKEFLDFYDYEDLVDSPTETINVEYWDKITSNFKLDNIGLLLAPGINSGFDFEGSGTYEIT